MNSTRFPLKDSKISFKALERLSFYGTPVLARVKYYDGGPLCP
jgi:hypothetical protein